MSFIFSDLFPSGSHDVGGGYGKKFAEIKAEYFFFSPRNDELVAFPFLCLLCLKP